MDSFLVQRAQARDQSGRFTKTLELLGSPIQTEQLAGIYALDALTSEAKELREAINEVLAAFVRRSVRPDRISGEIQAALTALTRTAQDFSGDRPLDLHGICLREAFLPHAHFERAFLYDCDFEGALLVGAHLQGAWLARANLTRANLEGADLRGADLRGAIGLGAKVKDEVIWDTETRWP